MEIFAIDNETYSNGEAIQGIDSLLWVERYREAGEFTIIGTPTSDFRKMLHIGQLISHTDTKEVMMVETHEIDETKDGEPKLKVTGRSVEAIVMERRVITAGWFLGYKDPATDNAIGISLVANDIWEHVEYLMQFYCQANLLDPNENIPNLNVTHGISRSDPNPINRFIPTGPLYPVIKDLLAAFDGGIKIERPVGDFFLTPQMEWIIHEGVDRREAVQFESNRGDIDRARYLWSLKGTYNKAYVQSQYYGLLVDPADMVGDPLTGWDVGALHVDFPELSDYYTGSDPAVEEMLFNVLLAKGWVGLMDTYQDVNILDATISPTSRLRYRTHYGMGDLVFVRGNYDMEQVMRVIEYAEVQDENGEYGYPTLTSYIPPISMTP